MSNSIVNNSLIKSLLEEIRILNERLRENNEKSDFSGPSCVFLYGFNARSKVEPEAYKRYVAFIDNISDVLREFGISVSNNGYSYIVDAVMLIMDQNNLDIKLVNDIYPYIKRKYRLSSESVVEHSIRNAIKSAYNRCLISKVVCRMQHYKKKPTNREFLYTVTQDVCSRMSAELML